MKQSKLNITYHNPNTDKDFSELLLKIFIDAGKKKIEQTLHNSSESNSLYIEECPE